MLYAGDTDCLGGELLGKGIAAEEFVRVLECNRSWLYWAGGCFGVCNVNEGVWEARPGTGFR